MDYHIKENTQIAIYFFVIGILIFLCFYVYFDSKNYSCDECRIEFKSTSPGQEINEFSIINISVQEIHKNLLQGTCAIIWDKSNGFMKNG